MGDKINLRKIDAPCFWLWERGNKRKAIKIIELNMGEGISFRTTFFSIIMKTFIAKYKVKNLEKIKEWAKIINSRKNEAFKTLKKEKVYIECAFLDKQQDEWYVIYFMKCENVKNAFKTLKKSKSKLDDYHKEILGNNLEKPIALQTLMDLENL